MKSTHSVDTTHGGFIRREHVAHGGINGSGIGLRRDWRRVPVRYVLAGLALLLAGALILLATETPGSRFIFGVLSGIAMGGGQAVRISARGTYFGRQSFATIAATGLLCGLPFYVATTATLFRLYDLDLTNEGLTMPASAALVGCRFGALGYLLAGTPQLAPPQQSPAEG